MSHLAEREERRVQSLSGLNGMGKGTQEDSDIRQAYWPCSKQTAFLNISSTAVTLLMTSKEINALGVLKSKIIRKINGPQKKMETGE
jgi:hypothetical protein